jgi:hypothetical protein
MGLWVPPYVNKHEKQLEKRLARAEKKEQACKDKYDTAAEYTRLCREALANAKK